MSNLLIVESHNDKYFLEALIRYLNLANVEVGSPVCNIDEFECLKGISRLKQRLKEIGYTIEKGPIAKLGIILDADKVGIDGRVKLIDDSLKEICSDVSLHSTNTLVKSVELEVEIACHIMNVDGFGELETLLKRIKSKPSICADCLDSWRECLDGEGKIIDNKFFDKFWIDIYQRYDICKMNESNADKNCRGEISMKKDIWDFEHPQLKGLKEFLQLFRD